MNIEKDRDYWTIVFDLGGAKLEPSTPYRIRLVRECLGVHCFSNELSDFLFESLTVMGRDLDRYIFETEEAAWCAYPKSSASPMEYLREVRGEVERRLDEFKRLIEREDVPKSARILLHHEIKAADFLLSRVPPRKEP